MSQQSVWEDLKQSTWAWKESTAVKEMEESLGRNRAKA